VRGATPRALPTATTLLTVLTFLTGCTAAAGSPDGPAEVPQPNGTVSLTNCGHQVTVPEVPRRIVTIKSSATETVLALGAGDRIVGTAAADGPLPDHLAPGTPAVISPEVPGTEAVLDLAPDLVYAGWESNLTAKSAGDRDRLAELGIATYVSPAACEGARHRASPMTFDEVFAEITEVGSILGVPEAAGELVERQEAELAALSATGDDRSALWFSSGNTTPYVGAGSGAPQMIMSTVGLRNVAAHVDDSWAPLSWEAVAAASPDVIVLVDAEWSPVETKVAALRGNPLTANLPAVVQSRFVTVDFAATQPGVRNVEAAASIAAQLTELPR